MAEVVFANSVEEGRVRITITGGPSPLGSERGVAGPTVIVAATPMTPWPPTSDVAVVPWPRNERGALAGLKTISYGENVVALAYARDQGAAEALFGNLAGDLCEGTGSNVFLAVDGRLVTPPLSSGCLAGVTRALVLETTDAIEAGIPLPTLATANEAFLTSTTREVQPIRPSTGHHLPRRPGPLTIAAAAALTALTARDLTRSRRRPAPFPFWRGRAEATSRDCAECTTSPAEMVRRQAPVSTMRWPSSVMSAAVPVKDSSARSTRTWRWRVAELRR